MAGALIGCGTDCTRGYERMMNQSDLQFQGGGSLQRNAFYLTRTVDDELFHALSRGIFCNIIAPRQIGKSSLRTRTERRLQDLGIRCVNVDLSTISTKDATAMSWYRGIAKATARQLDIAAGFEAFWSAGTEVPASRWITFLREYIPTYISEPIVIFVDETDSVLSLSFKVDDFFAAIRSIYNARADDERGTKLTFCFLGVLATGDLIDDPNRTPFNVGEAIRLADFTREEIQPLAEGLNRLTDNPDQLLDQIYQWTSGHPYMTQKICEKLVSRGSAAGVEMDRVTSLVRELFIERGESSDENLDYAARRLASRPRSAEMLDLYRRVRSGERVLMRRKGSIEEELWLTGMIAEHSDGDSIGIRTRNQIFEEVFDETWIERQEAQREFSEPLRQWRQHDQHADYLLRGAALAKALQWAKGRELTREEHEYLREGLAKETRQRVLIAIATATIFIVITILGSMLWNAKRTQTLTASVKQLETEKMELEAERLMLNEALEQTRVELEDARAARDSDLKKIQRELTQAQDDLETAMSERQNVLIEKTAAEKEVSALRKQHDNILKQQLEAERQSREAIQRTENALAQLRAERDSLKNQSEQLKESNEAIRRQYEEAKQLRQQAIERAEANDSRLISQQRELMLLREALKSCSVSKDAAATP